MEFFMKTEEDEAFDDLARRQGAWGGGYRAKRAAAADKLQEPIYNITVFDNAHPKGIPLEDWVQPAQEPDMLTIVYQSGYHDGKKAALAGREWVGLTVDERDMIVDASNRDVFDAMTLAEAKLKEKNNG
jgi:hypothetical protein